MRNKITNNKNTISYIALFPFGPKCFQQLLLPRSNGYYLTDNITHNLIRNLPGTHLYTWVESSNVDKVSC